MMTGNLPPRPPDWLPNQDDMKPDMPNPIHKLATWDVRIKIILSIWFRLCLFITSGIGVTALILLIWRPSILTGSINLIEPLIQSENRTILPVAIILAVAYALRFAKNFFPKVEA